MRKFIVAMAIAALTVSVAAHADEYVKGGFEASGHVNAGLGWQHWSKNTGSAVSVAPGLASTDSRAGYGVLGNVLDPRTGALSGGVKDDSFAFFVHDVELDLMKSLGENIKVRTDLDFTTGQTNAAAVGVEQAYVTTNVALGNGGEFLVGKFNAPIGFESVDVNANSTFSRSAIYNYLRPHNLTGVKFYYPWTDSFDWHFYVVNNLRDAVNTTLAGGINKSYVPSVGTRLGFIWGDEAQPSTFGVSIAGGFESTAAQKYGDLSYLADVDWNWWFNDAFAFGGEAIYRVDNNNTAVKNGMAFGGLLNLNYAFSDVWDGTLKYAFVDELKNRQGTIGDLFPINGVASTAGLMSHELSLAAQYHITDGAKVQAEGRFDYLKLKGATKTYDYGAALNFAYDF